MPMPWTYRHASREWQAFLADVKDRMDLASDNMAYTAVDGVLQVFRRRLTPQQGIAFANVLPSVLRAIFVKDWEIGAAPLPFGTRADLVAEVKAVRRHHNLTPDTAIEDTAWALWRCVNHREFEAVLDDLPPEARAFWAVQVDDPAELATRMV
jgi:uncharacterized protein (DUF2267 family)